MFCAVQLTELWPFWETSSAYGSWDGAICTVEDPTVQLTLPCSPDGSLALTVTVCGAGYQALRSSLGVTVTCGPEHSTLIVASVAELDIHAGLLAVSVGV